MNTIITAEDAENWLNQTGFGDPEVQKEHIESFITNPELTSHALIAMLCIAKSAETPQNYEDVYYSVRDVAEAIQDGSTGAPQNDTFILREAVFAKNEMTKDEFDKLEFDKQFTERKLRFGISIYKA